MAGTDHGRGSGAEIAVVGGRVIDLDGSRDADLAVDPATGRIVEVGPPGSVATGDRRILDATGCVVSGGFVDLNADLGEPGNEAAETIRAGTRAAALGGYTAVVLVGEADPCPDSAAAVAEVTALAAADGSCAVVASGALTVGRSGRALAPIGELVRAGIRFFTDGDDGIDDPAILRRVMEYAAGVAAAAGVTVVVASRPEMAALAEPGVMNEGSWSSRLGLPGRSAVAEDLAVQRDLALAQLVGVPLHVQQVSTAGAVEAIRSAKASGVAVTAEVSPHHLVLDESACATFDPAVKLRPPLRTAADVAALRAAVIDGTIDAIATAHRPCTVDAKERPFDEAPWGAIGLESTLAVLLTETDLGLDRLVPALSWRPAAIAGLAERHPSRIVTGAVADLAVVDPDHRWVLDARSMASRARNTPFDGRELRGAVRHTLWHGRPTVVDHRSVTAEPPAPAGVTAVGVTAVGSTP